MDTQHAHNEKQNAGKDPEKGNVPETEKTVTLSVKEHQALRDAAGERDIYYDKYLRAHAELENVRKRLEKEKLDFLQFASSEFVYKLLPILDNLEIAMKHITNAKDFTSMQAGMKMIQIDVRKFLKELGVEKVKTVGEQFDPLKHDAIEFSDSGGAEGVVVDELIAGYAINGRLIRPASVRIVKHKCEEGKAQAAEDKDKKKDT